VLKNYLNMSKRNAIRAAAVTGVLLMSGAAIAGEVTLKSADGTVNLTGEFVEFKDDNYVVRTALGDLTISASRVRCEGASCPSFDTATSDVSFYGSYTVGLGAMPLLLSGYAANKNAEISITNTQNQNEILAKFTADNGFGDEIGSYLVTSTPSSGAFEKLLEDGAVIGMASRRIKPAEARALRDAGKGNMISVDQEHILAVDSLVIIVNPENGINSISVTDLQGIYSGVITNWNQLGGADLPIKVVTHRDGSGTLAVFQKRIFGKDAPAAPEGATVGVDSNEIAAFVNDNPGAIGFVGYAFQRGAKPLNLVNECGISSTPDPFSAKTEEYALQRRLYLYNAENPDQRIQDFITYATSNAADGVIAKAGFIDLSVSRRAQTMDSPRASSMLNADVDAFEGNVIREMLAEMVKSDRLSSTFRFTPGSSRLDERGLLEMERLAEYLQDLPEGTKVTMVGFTDSVGAFEANRKLSQSRAQQVVDMLKSTAGDRVAHIEFAATGFGEISPSGCNTSETGRGANRRVEVWLGNN